MHFAPCHLAPRYDVKFFSNFLNNKARCSSTLKKITTIAMILRLLQLPSHAANFGNSNQIIRSRCKCLPIASERKLNVSKQYICWNGASSTDAFSNRTKGTLNCCLIIFKSGGKTPADVITDK
uniref:Uncharacterized protein n=1 Tax=Romanomermis culicivorax TaxID=13658 RepID=A0A915I008_ROMCU